MKKAVSMILVLCMLISCIPAAAFAQEPSSGAELVAATEAPTAAPTDEPAEEPTAAPTEEPAEEPTAAPTEEPVVEPTAAPTEEPTEEPTAAPTEEPTEEPTAAPDAISVLRAPLFTPLDVTVETPMAFTVAQLDMRHGYISWARVSGVDGYEIQRSTSSDFSSGVFVVKPAAAATNVTISMECGKTYYFRMRAYVNTDVNNIVYSEWTSTLSLATSPEAPKELTGTAISSTSVELHWPAVSGVTGYIIHRDNVQIGKIGGANNTTYTDEGLTLGTIYTYTVYSYCKQSNGTEVASAQGKELSYICVPPAPQNVTAESAGVSSILIQWDKVPGVSSYEIYRAPASGANFRLVSTVIGDSTLSYTDPNRVSGETYQYYVVAVVSASVKSERSEMVTGVARALAPTGVKAQYVDSSQIKLTWDAVEDSNGYIIQVSSRRDSGYTELEHGALETCSYIDKGLSTGQRRYYRICAYMGEYGDVNRYGAWSQVVSDATRPKAPSGIKLTNVAYNKLGLTYNASEGADGYEISQSTNGKTFTVVSRRTGTSYRSGALTVGKTYYYRVRAYTLDTDGVSKIYGKYSAVKSLMVTLLAPSDVNVKRLNPRTNGVEVQWSSVWGANGYYIYVNQDKTGSKFLAKTGTETSYKAKNLNQGSSYVFWVRAYRLVDGREVLGLLQKADAITLHIPVVQFKGVTAGAASMSVVVSWGKVYGVEGYHVEVEGKDDDYTLSTDTTNTSITLGNLSLGNRYTCRVKAYSTVKGNRVEGPEGVKENISPSAPVPASLNVYTLKQSYGLYLTWEPVKGCSGYRIQRSQKRDSGYTDLLHIEGSGNSEYFNLFTNEEAGDTYYYRVCSYMDNMGVRTYSANTTARSATVRAPMPENLRTTNNNSTSITLHWDAVPFADGYQIYQANKADGVYSLIEHVDGSQTSLNLTGLVAGVDYYFKVCAFNMRGSVTVLGTLSDAVYGSPTLAAPRGLKGVAYPKSVRLSWNAASNASGYKVYMSSDGGANYKEIGTTTSLSYEVKNLQCGSTYLFKVAAYRSAGGNTYKGIDSAPISKRTGITPPKGVSVASVNSSKIQISWKAMKEVDGFEVYKATSIDGTYTLAGEVNAKTLKLVNTVDRTGYPYCYKVRAYAKLSNGSRYYSAFSSPLAGRALPNAPQYLVASRVWRLSVTVNWTETDSTAGYKVFYRQRGASSWNVETLVGPNITQYIISGLKKNTTYEIIVKPICYNEKGSIINGYGQTNMLTVRTKK